MVAGGRAAAGHFSDTHDAAEAVRTLAGEDTEDPTQLVTDRAKLRAHLAAFAEAARQADKVVEALLPARKKGLNALGYRSAGLNASDDREVQTLAPVAELFREHKRTTLLAKERNRNSGQQHGDIEVEPGWTIAELHRDMVAKSHVTDEFVNEKFVRRLVEASAHPEAEEAKREIARADPDALKSLEERRLLLQRRAEKKRSQLNARGVFTDKVNVVRARATLRVELRRYMGAGEVAALRPKAKPEGLLRSFPLNLGMA